MRQNVGEEVGYSVRFDERWDPDRTRIKLMTDGMLLRETMIDPLLREYSVIMLDEAHERSLHTDIILGLLKKIRKRRPELRLIISSATLDAEDFASFFQTARKKRWDVKLDSVDLHRVAILSVEGRQFPVEMCYSLKPVGDYLESAVQTVVSIHKQEPHGNVLVFVTGQEEVETVVTLIREQVMTLPGDMPDLTVVPLYAGLRFDEQMKAFEVLQTNARKVVVATNIAETSVTIDGIVYVVDCGFVKQKIYNPENDTEVLAVVPVSQAQAHQRAGRAGRLGPGKCFRLYPENLYNEGMQPVTIPEMQRTGMAWVTLQLKALGINDVLHFDFMSPPVPTTLMRALELLYSLGALDEQGRLTPDVGALMAEMPLEPQLSKMMLAGCKDGCGEEVLSIAAMLSVSQPFHRNSDAARRTFAVAQGDHVTLLNVYNAYNKHRTDARWLEEHRINYRALNRATEIRRQLAAYLRRFEIEVDSCDGDAAKICRAVAAAFFCNAARLELSGEYRAVRSGQRLALHPSSVVFKSPPQWIVFHEVVHTTKAYCRDVTSIDPTWLTEIAPHYYQWKKSGGTKRPAPDY